jgi:hypothetical protein
MVAAAMPIEIGSAEHRRILARFFLDTHVDYAPDAIEWPALGEPGRRRLAGLPFWQEAVSTENVTSTTVSAAAGIEPDPELRRAIEMQGLEERRHARLLLALTRHYRIEVDAPPPFEPRALETEFLFAGFGECFDSFFAFGLFALARESGFFEPALIAIFEPVIQEEARHILFFVNWVKYRRSQFAWWRRPAFDLRCAWIILRQVASRVRTARTLGAAPADPAAADPVAASADNFTLTAHREIADAVTLHKLLEVCLRENDRRMAHYDRRLLRPRLVPSIAKFLHRVLPARL